AQGTPLGAKGPVRYGRAGKNCSLGWAKAVIPTTARQVARARLRSLITSPSNKGTCRAGGCLKRNHFFLSVGTATGEASACRSTTTLRGRAVRRSGTTRSARQK